MYMGQATVFLTTHVFLGWYQGQHQSHTLLNLWVLGLPYTWPLCRDMYHNKANIAYFFVPRRHTFAPCLQYHQGETWCANVHVRASKMEDGKCGAQTRCHFSHFNTDVLLETDVQESSCVAWINAISNLAGSVLYYCWAECEIWRTMHERTWHDAPTYIASKQRMRERTLGCYNERFLVQTNGYWLLSSLFYHL